MLKRLIYIQILIAITTSSSLNAGYVALPDDEAGRCKYGAKHMIEIGRLSLLETSSRPARIEKRRKLVEEWSSRLENGDDPCRLYMDIQKAASIFGQSARDFKVSRQTIIRVRVNKQYISWRFRYYRKHI